MTSAFRDKAATFVLPCLVGALLTGLPSAYALGVSKGTDAGGVLALTKRVEKAEEVAAADARDAKADHDAITRMDASMSIILKRSEKIDGLAESIASLRTYVEQRIAAEKAAGEPKK